MALYPAYALGAFCSLGYQTQAIPLVRQRFLKGNDLEPMHTAKKSKSGLFEKNTHKARVRPLVFGPFFMGTSYLEISLMCRKITYNLVMPSTSLG